MRLRAVSNKSILALVAAGFLLACSGCAASGGAESKGTTSDEDVAKHVELMNEAMKSGSEWRGPTEPVDPPKGTTMSIITCMSALYGCLAPAEAAAEAAELLGWDVTINDGQGDPSVQNRLVEQAVSAGVDAIMTTAVDAAYIRSGLKAARAAGIPVVSANQGTAPSEEGFDVDVTTDYADFGRAQASWVIADSKGKATVLPLNDKEYEDIVDYVDGFVDTLKKDCPGCTVLEEESFVGADVGNGLGARVVQLLQRNPDIDYVLGTYDPACADMVSAISSAGIADRVKMACSLGDPQNLEFIREGKVEAAVAAIDLRYNGYAIVDQLARLMTGQPLAERDDTDNPKLKHNENAPYRLITADNVEELEAGRPWESSFDFVDEYKKLWGLL